MKDAFGIILTGENEIRLRELTRSRSIAALPIACRYRVIDVILSNMVYSGITNIGIITQKNYHSLMDHLESGKEWDLSRKRDGLFILPPYVSRENTGSYDGMLDAIRSNMGYVRRSTQRYAVISGSSTLFNMNLDPMMEAHVKSGADITMLYNVARFEPSANDDNHSQQIYLDVDQNGRVRDIEINPLMPRYHSLAMDVYIMEKSLLQYLVDSSVAHGRTDFGRDILQKMFGELRIFGYRYDGFVARMDSVESYYRFNMNLLDPTIRTQMLSGESPVLTKVKDEVPARYDADAKVSNSLVADGCIIEGQVENSILFRGVRIGRGCVVKDCILMQNTEVQDGAQLAYMITDKNAFIKRDRRLMGQPTYPGLIAKNSII